MLGRGSATSSTRSNRRRRRASSIASSPAREVAFQLDAFAQAANTRFQLFGDDRVFDEARRAIRERTREPQALMP